MAKIESSTVFLYEKIKIGIQEMIKNNQMKNGEQLPNEKELCELFDASRISVRRAVKELESENVIEVIHGKGTFVKLKKRPLHMVDMQGFTEGLSSSENDFTKKILSKELISATEELKHIFDRNEDFMLISLTRLIKDEHDVFSLDNSFIPCDIYPDLFDRIEDNVSTFKLMEEASALKFHRTKKQIEVVFPNDYEQELFNISRIDPLIKVKKRIFSKDGKVLHYSNYFLLASRVIFEIDSVIHK